VRTRKPPHSCHPGRGKCHPGPCLLASSPNAKATMSYARTASSRGSAVRGWTWKMLKTGRHSAQVRGGALVHVARIRREAKFQAVPCAQQKAGVQQDAAAAAMGDRADPQAALCLRYLQALFEIDSTRVGKPASATARSVCLTSPSLRPCTADIPSEHLFNCTDARHLAVLMSQDTRCMPGMHFCFFVVVLQCIPCHLTPWRG
jgi:hypothetical protein